MMDGRREHPHQDHLKANWKGKLNGNCRFVFDHFVGLTFAFLH